MNFFSAPIAISLSPNTEADDVFLSLKTLIQPWIWQQGEAQKKVQLWFKKKFLTEQVVLYNSGRAALFEILKAFGIGKGDEVIVQAFTCVAVPNSVLWNGAIPVYGDIDASYNLDPEKIEKLITKSTKAIIVQHTFGIPAEIDKIEKIATKYHLILIEDCAHALGASYKGKLLGTWGDAAFFSFGRDKILSSVFGGVGIVRNDQYTIGKKLEEQATKIPQARFLWIFQQLIHPVAFAIILPFYSVQIGKMVLILLQKLHLLTFPVYAEEKKGKQPADFPSHYPNALAILAFNQLKKLDRYNENRIKAVEKYRELLTKDSAFIFPPHRDGAIYLRLPVQHNTNVELLSSARKQGILLGNWYHAIIDPSGVDYYAIGYHRGSCSTAELYARHNLNLPTRITSREVSIICHVLLNK